MAEEKTLKDKEQTYTRGQTELFCCFDSKDVKEAVLKLIDNIKLNMFSNGEIQDDIRGEKRLEHNQQLQLQINEIIKIFGNFD